MSRSSVAVVIVNWHSEPLLLECLHHLGRQRRAPDRVLVFDNSPGPGSLAQARRAYGHVEFLDAGGNVGFARACNLAVQRCGDCEWICLLNPDACPEQDWLEALLAAAAGHPGYDSFASLILDAADPECIDSAGDEYLPSGVALHRLRGRRRAESAPQLLRPVPVLAAAGAAAMYRRSVFLQCGGFDESLFAFYEDVDLGLRLQLAGHRCLLVPQAVVRHAGGGTTGGAGSAIGAYYGQRNFILVFFKDMPAALLWRALPRHLLAVLRNLFGGMRRGRGLLLARATAAALARLPACFAARRAIHARRAVSSTAFAALLSTAGAPDR